MSAIAARSPECTCGGRKKPASALCRSCFRVAARAASDAGARERLLALVDRSGGPDACWPLMGHRESNGYGRFHMGAKATWAHRASYQLFVGPIPKGLDVRHGCDNRPCCNPAHLATGTRAENMADAMQRGRLTRSGDSGRWSRV